MLVNMSRASWMTLRSARGRWQAQRSEILEWDANTHEYLQRTPHIMRKTDSTHNANITIVFHECCAHRLFCIMKKGTIFQNQIYRGSMSRRSTGAVRAPLRMQRLGYWGVHHAYMRENRLM